MKEFFTINITLLLLLTAAGCQLRMSEPYAAEQTRAPVWKNMFTVPGQQIHHPDVYSLQLFRRGSENSAPVIRLGSPQQLMLRFDMIETGTRQFRVTITHHNPDWSRSPLPPEDFMEGFSEAFFGGGKPSGSQRPAYRQYEYTFPNRELVFTGSGNFMLHVEDFETRRRLFSLPFFIHENAGQIVSSTETVFAPREELRVRHMPNSTYRYPDFIEIPGFDLEFHFVQNQFWGRMQQADVMDTSTPGSVFYEISRELAFTGDYEIRFLDLQDISAPGTVIREYRPDYVPPRLILDIDIQGLGVLRRSPAGSRFGRPDPDPDARYGDLRFSFRPRQAPEGHQEIYLVGDFSGWTIREDLALRHNPDTGEWETGTYVKEGSYAYKYVLLDGNVIRDLAFDDTFVTSRQEYTTFVYFRDPVRHHYRLLQTNTFHTN